MNGYNGSHAVPARGDELAIGLRREPLEALVQPRRVHVKGVRFDIHEYGLGTRAVN